MAVTAPEWPLRRMPPETDGERTPVPWGCCHICSHSSFLKDANGVVIGADWCHLHGLWVENAEVCMDHNRALHTVPFPRPAGEPRW